MKQAENGILTGRSSPTRRISQNIVSSKRVIDSVKMISVKTDEFPPLTENYKSDKIWIE